MDELTALRARFRFDIARLRGASARVHAVDGQLRRARESLRTKSGGWTKLAVDLRHPELGGSPGVQLLYAKAHAAAALSRRAGLRELLATAADGLALVSSMATSAWVASLQGLRAHAHGETLLRSHVEAGRMAYRILRSVRRQLDHVEGIGQLTSALVVFEFVHPLDERFVAAQLCEGLARARANAGPGQTDEDLHARVSAALREATLVLEAVAERSEPLADGLAREADGLERRVESLLEADGTDP